MQKTKKVLLTQVCQVSYKADGCTLLGMAGDGLLNGRRPEEVGQSYQHGSWES